ncbi:MAG: hypothetical protein ABSB13_07270 [Candidatus Binatus sp.]|jgi:hypothetical protein|uniref:hypothetical protein n=1 Tax=Candidatus Binatus sp. TaxID=2811406 RepID=UPI003D0AE6B7
MEFTGTSANGDFSEALRNAIALALKAEHAADAMVTYKIARIGGRSGGIVEFNELTVVIDSATHPAH